MKKMLLGTDHIDKRLIELVKLRRHGRPKPKSRQMIMKAAISKMLTDFNRIDEPPSQRENLMVEPFEVNSDTKIEASVKKLI